MTRIVGLLRTARQRLVLVVPIGAATEPYDGGERLVATGGTDITRAAR